MSKGNSRNNNPNNDIKAKIKIDYNEAMRDLKNLTRQASKLGDLSEQGTHMQKGFLSPKQFDLYKKILKEMETTYSQHTKKLENLNDSYNKRYEQKEFKKLRDLEDQLRKRQEAVKNAEGGNKWGDVASTSVREFHAFKLEEANQNLNDYRKSEEFMTATARSKELEAELEQLRQAVGDLTGVMNQSGKYTAKIDQMHVRDPRVDKLVEGLSQVVAASGAITSLGHYINYTQEGIVNLRQQELDSANITQKLGTYGYENADSKHRDAIKPIGMDNQFSVQETLQTQSMLIRGGSTDAGKLNLDTDSAQRFGRSYGLDPGIMASQNALLRQSGAVSEGDMARQAELIAGAIKKNGMSGREEEMMRATTSLAQSMSVGLEKLSERQYSDIVGLQTQIGQVDTLRGDRGANLLSNMDQAIRGGDNLMDLLLGKGVEFQGLQGMVDLGYLKEEGAANPENIQRILQNSERIMGRPVEGNEYLEKVLADMGFLSQHEFRALDEAGVLSQWKDGNFSTPEELRKLGLGELADKQEQWQGTKSIDREANRAHNENFKADHATAAEEVATSLNSLWRSLPDELKHILVPAAGVGGIFMAGKAGRMVKGGLDRVFRSGKNVGEKRGVPTPNKLNPDGTKGGVKNLSSMLDKGKTVGGSLLSQGKEYVGDLSKSITPELGKGVGKVGSKIPIAGTVLGAVGDQMANPEHDFGRSVARGVGGGIGGALGFALGGLAGVPTGGLAWLGLGAATAGGGLAGEATGDWLYSLFNGKEDKIQQHELDDKEKDNKVKDKLDKDLEESTKNKDLSKASGRLEVTDLNINDRSFADYLAMSKGTYSPKDNSKGNFSYATSNIYDRLKETEKEHTVRVIIDGKIEGMDKENEKEVKDSIAGYFMNLSRVGNFGMNLAMDQRRT